MGEGNSLNESGKVDQVQAHKILEETVRKELAHLSISPTFQKRAASMLLMPDKPTRHNPFKPLYELSDSKTVNAQNVDSFRKEIRASTYCGPHDRYHLPVTASHEVGWMVRKAYEHGVFRQTTDAFLASDFPGSSKRKCDVVKYAEAKIDEYTKKTKYVCIPTNTPRGNAMQLDYVLDMKYEFGSTPHVPVLV